MKKTEEAKDKDDFRVSAYRLQAMYATFFVLFFHTSIELGLQFTPLAICL